MMASRCVACWRKGITTVLAQPGAGGVRLCNWHEDGTTDEGETPQRMRMLYGPSLMDGSKSFRAAYGTDAELLELQEQMLRGEA